MKVESTQILAQIDKAQWQLDTIVQSMRHSKECHPIQMTDAWAILEEGFEKLKASVGREDAS